MKDKFYALIAAMLPKAVVYYAAIRLFVHATTGEYSNQEVPALTAMDALKRWETAGPRA